MRTVADTDGNGNSRCKRYAYRHGDGNTDAYAYADSKGYAGAERSADPVSAPDPALVTLTCPS